MPPAKKSAVVHPETHRPVARDLPGETVTLKAQPAVKSGLRSTEFYAMLVPLVVSALLDLHIVHTAAAAQRWANLVAGLALVGYQASRGWVKAAAVKAAAGPLPVIEP